MSCYSFLNENILYYPFTALKIQARKAYKNRNILWDKYKKYRQKNNEIVDDLNDVEDNDNVIHDPVTGKNYIIRDDVFIELPISTQQDQHDNS
jgi:hypothetical protein